MIIAALKILAASVALFAGLFVFACLVGLWISLGDPSINGDPERDSRESLDCQNARAPRSH